MSLSSVELLRDGPSYTIDTVRHFTASDNRVTLIMGTDSLAEIETWRQGRELLDMADVIAYPRRPFTDTQLMTGLPGWVSDRVGKTITILEETPADISSTEIRMRVTTGKPILDLVPEEVEELAGSEIALDRAR